MYKLAHISDVHLGPLPAISLRELMSKRITGYINWHRNRKSHLFGDTLTRLIEHIRTQTPDHLAITGDLVNLATGIEIDKAGNWLENLGDPQEISVVPGNHDAYVPGAVTRALNTWRPYVVGDNAPMDGTPQFPYMRIRGPLALIGCSTAHATPPFSANGTFGRHQARRTTELLKQAGERGLCRVIMIHHPPVRGAAANYKRMTGIGRFGEMLAEAGAEMVLHGHTHLNTLYRLDGRDGSVPVIGIASASQGPGGKKPPSGYNLFSISGDAGQWNIQHDRYAMEGEDRAFILAESQTL